MAAASSTFSSAVGSHEDLLVRPLPPHEWELLSMSTVSSSTLLSCNNGLGSGLPPLSAPSIETEGSRVFGFGGSSVPLDVSQIAVMCSSTSSLEPFSEGWKPQFRIAGTAPQENYYAPDPFAWSAAANASTSFVEPFSNMEHSFIKELFTATERGTPEPEGKQSSISTEKGFPNWEGHFASTDSSRGTRPFESSQDDDQLLSACGQVKKSTQTSSEVPDATRKAESRKVIDRQGKRSRQMGHGKINGRSYLAWSVALTTTLFGAFLISYCLHNEFPSGDESPNDAGYRHGLKEAVLRRWKMAVT